MRKYGKVYENLQMFVDEHVWRAEHRSLAEKRESLCKIFNFKLYQETKDDLRNGIVGGYG